MSDAAWIAIPLIITAIFTGLTTVITLLINNKATKGNEQNEQIKKEIEVVHKTINSGLSVQLEKEKVIGRFEGAAEERKIKDAVSKGAAEERGKEKTSEVRTEIIVEKKKESPTEIKNVEIKGDMKINPPDKKK